MKKNLWHKPRHNLYYFLGKEFLKRFLRVKMGFVREKKRLPKGPGIIIANHVTNYDPFFIAINAKELIYFVVTTDAFAQRSAAFWIDHTVRPIPKVKGMNDLSTVKTMLECLKEGYKVGVFPEGNRTYSGDLCTIDPSIAKFIKKAKVPVYVYSIEGGYAASPRWSKKVRKSEIHANLKKTLTVEEVQNMELDEIYDVVIKNMTPVENKYQVSESCENLAENLETALYYCPECGSLHKLVSSGDNFKCTSCGYEVKYNRDLTFTLLNGKTDIKDVSEWYHKEEDYMNSISLEDNLVFEDDNINLVKLEPKTSEKKLVQDGSIYMDKNEIAFNKGKVDEIKFAFEDISAVSVYSQNKLSIHIGHTTYRVRAGVKFCALKYMQYYYRIKNIKSNSDSKNLGI